MESRYVEADAARAVSSRPEGVSEALALRTYTARLLGADMSLVLHGGGNTSVKAEARTIFGETVPVLHVKGSGWDLATIEPPGHPACRMATLLALLDLPEMTDEQMVNEMRLSLLDAGAPTPSVEALLHAALPARFIDHTHADAILAIADQDDGEKICRSLFGERLLWIPYVMPGFGLAKACKKAWDASIAQGRTPSLMILERHGIFTWGDTAKESYERMIEAVTLAERHAHDKMGTSDLPGLDRDPALEARVIPIVRGALATVAGESPEKAPIVAVRSNEWILHFLERKDAYELTQRGCATPDHVIRTKPVPLFVPQVDVDDEVALAAHLEREIADFARRYDRYFEETCSRRGLTKTKLDPWPRVVLIPKIGILAVGKTKKDAEIVADVYEHTLQVITDAEDVGRYSPVSRDHLFDVEYWSLEQAKIKKTAELPLSRQIAVVTGAAGGIGKATTRMLLELGAHVVACDREPSALATLETELRKHRPALVVVRADVTDRAQVDDVLRVAARTFGGVDLVVSNAGDAPEGRLDTSEGIAALERSLSSNLLAHVHVAAAASRIFRLQRRGGCLLFNASKSAFNPGPGFGPYAVAKAGLVALMRQHAVDLGRFGIRANAVNADRIRTGIFEGGVLASRAAARGLSVDEYFRSNLLSREVTADDVAASFAYLAQARSTTGCVVTVDGGNAAAFPR
ncbi:MAG: bifunctional aldolase/short-chain dehydrogenase [Deltaproteobacteria bacterium]|nr:bifunctional aldolase/short-chain dehydrogenase [Deltaproteobacteria bacterium]